MMDKYIEDSWQMNIHKGFDKFDELSGVIEFAVGGINVKCKERTPNFWGEDNFYLIEYDYAIPLNHEVFKLIDFEDYKNDEEIWEDNYFLDCLNDARMIVEEEINSKINREQNKYFYDYMDVD